MLCELPKAEKSRHLVGRLPILSLSFILNLAMIIRTPMAQAQVSSTENTGGAIAGTVLLETDRRPATQVAVTLKSHAEGVFRSVLTDYDGQFEVRGLPSGTYEINVEEAGYETSRTSVKLDGPSLKVELRLKPTPAVQPARNGYTVSVRQLKISGKAHDEYKKGLESLGKKDFAGSLSHFTNAVKVYPEYYEAFYHLGIAETNLGRMEEAMQNFQRAIDLSSGRYAWAEFGLGYVLFLEGRAGEAETVIRRGLEEDGNSPDGFAILGMVLLRLNRTDEAERSAREALLRKPDFAQAYLVLSDAYARRREYRAQLQGLDTYLKLEPNGAASERVRRAREMALKVLAESHPN
jgi:tetratricopeptide (TPR) repeat protein